MIDAAKYADLVLLMVDGGFGFEMETFEFLNLLQVAVTFMQGSLLHSTTNAVCIRACVAPLHAEHMPLHALDVMLCT